MLGPCGYCRGTRCSLADVSADADTCWADLHRPGMARWPCASKAVTVLGLCQRCHDAIVVSPTDMPEAAA